MLSFEDLRTHLSASHTLRDNDPYLISFDIDVGEGRRQGMYLAEITDEGGRRFLRVSTPVAPIGRLEPAKCLRFNWAQRVGFLALNDLDGEPYLQLCENRPLKQLTVKEVDRVVAELGALADQLEHAMNKGKDVL
jgi:hypothetical protein